MACTGIEFCKLAIVETKARAADLISELERRLPGFDAPVTINVNGCPNSCARIQTADIGLKGSLVTGPDGQQVEGFQVHLGGSLSGGDGSGSGFGRKVRGLKTTAEDAPVTINVNGCPNSCARIQTADIGLKGSLVTGPDGQQVEGFQVHLGGSLSGGDGSGSGFGRKVRGLKTTAEELPDYVERVLRRFDAAREPGESFAAWTVRASDEELS